MTCPRAPIRIAIIGTGRQGLKYLASCQECAGFQLVATADPQPHSVPEIAHFLNLRQLLRQASPEAVLIATPHNVHYDLTRECLSARIPVLKEKPLALSSADATSLRDLGGLSTPMLVATQRRHTAGFRALERVLPIASRLFWRIHYAIPVDRVREDRSWRRHRSVAGDGVLADLGYHVWSLLSHLSVSPEELSVDTWSYQCAPRDVSDRASVHAITSTGLEVQIELDLAAGESSEVLVLESAGGNILLSNSITGGSTLTDCGTVEYVLEPDAVLRHRQLHEFHRVLKGSPGAVRWTELLEREIEAVRLMEAVSAAARRRKF